MFAAEIRARRQQGLRSISRWRWHLDEVFVRVNGVQHYLWRAVDGAGGARNEEAGQGSRETRTIRNADLHHGADYTPYEGLEVAGGPVTAILRGRIAARDGAVLIEPGAGVYLRRRQSSLIDGIRC